VCVFVCVFFFCTEASPILVVVVLFGIIFCAHIPEVFVLNFFLMDITKEAGVVHTFKIKKSQWTG
jgi:hypothetical protein